VIGGGSDIGRAIIEQLAPEYDIVWSYCNTNVDQSGLKVKCDLRDVRQITELFNYLDELDLMVTAAFPFIESENFDFDAYLQVETFQRAHVFAMTRAAQIMNEGGKIINILGQCVDRGLPGGAFYSAAFAFLHNYGNSINAREGKAGKISVCDLLLGPVDTREWSSLSAEVVDRYKAKVSQFITPQQVAETVAFFAKQPVMPRTHVLDAYYGL
jgi:NAD(P)-dependent dehydrogenase (short-subunit alcohol dehydrogenase family)